MNNLIVIYLILNDIKSIIFQYFLNYLIIFY